MKLHDDNIISRGYRSKIMHMSRLFSFVCYLLGTPDTRRKGRKTRNALSALTSKPFIFTRSRIVLTTLEYRKIKLRELKSLAFDFFYICFFIIYNIAIRTQS